MQRVRQVLLVGIVLAATIGDGWLGADCRRTTDHCLWPPSAVRPQLASLGNGRRAGGDLPVRFTRTFRPKSRQIDPSHPAD
jgi:hypothetical protein